MNYYLLVFSFQVIFNVLKVLEIRFTYQEKIPSLLINSVLINLVSLASVYYSLDRLFEQDWWIILAYTSGSVCGKWIGMHSKWWLPKKIKKKHGRH